VWEKKTDGTQEFDRRWRGKHGWGGERINSMKEGLSFKDTA